MTEMIRLLGEILSERISISMPAARGLIKLSIKDEVGPFIPFEKLRYQDYKNTINNSLYKRLQKLEIPEPVLIIKLLKENLKNAQSLIVMSEI